MLSHRRQGATDPDSSRPVLVDLTHLLGGGIGGVFGGTLTGDLSRDLLLHGRRVASLVLDLESRCRRGRRESDRDRLECRLRSVDLDRVLDLFARWSRRSSI